MKLNYILSALAGALMGAGLSYVITKKVIQARCDEEIQAYKDHADKLRRELESIKNDNPTTNKEPNKASERETSIEDLSKNVDKAYEEYNKAREKIKWQGQMTVDEAMETGDAELIKAAEWLENGERAKTELTKGQDGSPYIISQLSWNGEGEGEYTYKEEYNHISLDWYAKDGVLAWGHNCRVDGEEYEAGQMVKDPPPTFVVGYKWKQHFGDPEYHNDDDCVYVRNDYLCCDFEIIRDEGSYAETVLGLDYDDSEGSEDASN